MRDGEGQRTGVERGMPNDEFRSWESPLPRPDPPFQACTRVAPRIPLQEVFREENSFPLEHCLSQGAGLSIILPSPHWKPWYLLPDPPVINRPRKRLYFP